MNIQAMMAQAKKLQSQLEKTTKEIDETIYKYENENILVEAFGSNKIKKINIKNGDVLGDHEMLEDVLLVAVNDVLRQIIDDKNKKLGKYTNGLGGLF
ncbi:MAG: YbaB/EbfC family nucleoid-associated protein [bacterium]|nr:YbaB/EbfC family nucleoid-associated protein [bacterium]